MRQSERGINIPIPKSYSLTQRAYCVPCIDWCRNHQNGLSKNQRNRRRIVYMDIDTPSSSLRQDNGQNELLEMPTVDLLKELYKEHNSTHDNIFESLKCKRLNPVEGAVVRDDIEYYIPQLITFLAFQIDLEDEDLVEFIMRACELHYLFSHCCYFYLNSISKVGDFEIPEIQSFIEDLFLPRMDIYKDAKLCGLELARCSNIPIEPIEPTPREIEAAEKYGTIEEDEVSGEPVRNIHIKNYSENGFMSTPSFWFDLIKIGNDLANCNPKIVGLKNAIRGINKKLPATVYIPFYRNSVRHYTILNIDADHARVFSTKERSPYSICIEIFREEEEFLIDEDSKIKTRQKNHKKANRKQLLLNRTLSRPLTILKDQNSLRLKKPKSVQQIHEEKAALARLKNQRSTIQCERVHVLPRQSFSVVGREKVNRSFCEPNQLENALGLSDIDEGSRTDGERSDHSNSNSGIEECKPNHSSSLIEPEQAPQSIMKATINKGKQGYVDHFFDIPFSEIEQKIRSRSIYRNFKTWRLVNIMVKTGDNLKQGSLCSHLEQFAMQLINQFDCIFKRENIDLLLRPYEVISLGPDSGILEMVTDTSSMGRILKNMRKERIPTLKQFFKSYFKSRHEEAKTKFCHSLAAYSLVTYFLQVKDRHNDNILLHRDGYIVHIDFGFFLSNAPGKGIELEKNCPFKLMSNYVEVLGGANSLLFMEFRSLFERGFRACLKYKDEIITLVKMMYSSHGESMPCFQKGSVAIDELETRFNPQAEDLGEHCQNLINQSLDNWRARWYDKVQYWLQGIFY